MNAHQPAFGGGVCSSLSYRCADAFIAKIGTGCTFSIAPATQAMGAAGGARTVAVTASSAACSWSAASGAAWITITSGAAGTGSGQVEYSVAAHTGTTERTGTVNIAGQLLTVTQSPASALSVTLTSPNGGEKVFAGTPYAITWTAAGATSFNVTVSPDGGATYAPIPECTGLAANARSCMWMMPGPPSPNARLKVTARNAGGSVADISNAAFSMVSGTASIAVTYPNKAINVGIGSTQVIQWTHNLGVGSLLKVELSRDGGVTFLETLAAAHRHDATTSGAFNWRVTGPATAAAQARIRITWTSGAASDVSNVNFIIAPAFIHVAAPQTTSRWGFQTTRKQAWTTNLGALDRVSVQLSAAGIGGPFSSVDGGSNIVATVKQANVLVPAIATATARVRVVWINPPAGVSAVGNNSGNFTIEAPAVAVTAPAAGAIWTIGSARTVTWSSNLGPVENVEIRLSRDGGATYPVVIAASTPSDGKHTVTVGAAWGSQSTTRLKVTWLKATGTTASSPPFVVQP